MGNYPSCYYIQYGINFYPNNIIKMCCFSNDPAVDAALTSDHVFKIEEDIYKKKQAMIEDFSNGNVYACCKSCPNLVDRAWGRDLKRISLITLNHFMFCNLKCGHCGYLADVEAKRLVDTDHARVLEIIKELKAHDFLAPSLKFDVGGGEPSVAEGLIEIVRYCIESGHHVHINSNGARYVETFVAGIQRGLLTLTLTPDAGSREVYKLIKGHDNYLKTWENITRYNIACASGVDVKFIIQEKNLNDIDNMILMSEAAGVRKITLSLDLNIPPARHADYRQYIDYFRSKAAVHSLSVEPSGLLPTALWG